MGDYIKKTDCSQLSELVDVKGKGKEINDWKGKKQKSLLLSDSYYRLGRKKFYRVETCSQVLEFRRYEDKTMKLNKANFCRDRLCSLCAWRRSLKIFGQTSRIMDTIAAGEKKYRYIFLTLTIKNVVAAELPDTLDSLFYGYKKLFQMKRLKAMSKGTFRALEVTYNKDTGTFHPHFHVIVAVNPSYFKDTKIYINQSEFRELWAAAMDTDYLPSVNVKAFKQEFAGIAEASKYTVKDTDFIVPDDEPLTDKLVYTFDTALKGRRLVAYTGIFRQIKKELNLDDAIDGDLINTDNEEIREDLNYVIERYAWNIGVSNYIRQKED